MFMGENEMIVYKRGGVATVWIATPPFIRRVWNVYRWVAV